MSLYFFEKVRRVTAEKAKSISEFCPNKKGTFKQFLLGLVNGEDQAVQVEWFSVFLSVSIYSTYIANLS